MSRPRYSIIIPVYNRPEEVDELLESLTHQQFKDFEVLIIEDGSSLPCREVVEKYTDKLKIAYHVKPNSGQGFSRNYGFERAQGEYLVVFDSDCLIPPHYFTAVEQALAAHHWDAWGGPDKAHPGFTPIQKAISYSMTSVFTTGGIRGSKKHAGTFHPRSFNMGISREVFEKTDGYLLTRMGEDIEFSIRIMQEGFKVGLIPDAFVYHKRRTDFGQFFKQLQFFGRARVNIGRFFKNEIRWVHLLPVGFVLALGFWLITAWIYFSLFKLGAALLLLFSLLIYIDSSRRNRSVGVGLLSIPAAFIQLTAYGIGFIKEIFWPLKQTPPRKVKK
jgi:glycosyltransferase involved in cell wall biosynthesis